MNALDGQRFAEETLPFRRTRRYCPACHTRFYQRVYAVLAVLILMFAGVGVAAAYWQHTGLLESHVFLIALLCILQWVMILPHEFAHMAAARALGFSGVRVLVGSGKPVLSFNLFGAPVLINLIPLGGITLFRPEGRPSRWKLLACVAAGPLVNVAAMLLCWRFIARNSLFWSEGAMLWKLVFGANLFTLAENLVPYNVRTPYGVVPSDGLQLWRLLFRWNKPISVRPARVPLWEYLLRQSLKWALMTILIAGAALFVGLGGFLALWTKASDIGWIQRSVLPVLMFFLAAVTVWASVRTAKHPIARDRNAWPAASLSWSPEQRASLLKAGQYSLQKEFAAAEVLIDEVLASIPDHNSEAYFLVLISKLECILSQGHGARAENVCLESMNQMAGAQQKIRLLDLAASTILYRWAPFLDSAERLIRKALEIAPELPTLKGTLGGILVEEGRLVEAEPLLRECLDGSPALHDQGITSFYLGVMRLSEGQRKDAKRLIKRAMALHPEPWLLAKAKARLKELKG